MSDVLQVLPIYAFMLIPVWIPLGAALVGAVADAVSAPARMSRRRSVVPARREVSAGRPVPAGGTAR